MTATGADPQSQPMSARAYHERSKHALGRYAPGPATLDWEHQPDPYRIYAGCARVPLPTGDSLPGSPAGAVPDPWSPPFSALRAREEVAAAPLGMAGIGRFLRLGLGISAWKEMGEVRWAVRCNPSSGNLHPVEAYLVLPDLDGLAAGLHHYEARDHALAGRCAYDRATADLVSRLAPPGSLLLGLSAIPWRESWKYGVRAWRYCQLDLGHAIAALDYAAACLGWRLAPVPDWGAADLGRLLGLDRGQEFEPDEPEFPQALFLVAAACARARSDGQSDRAARRDLLARLPGQGWRGRAERLDPRHVYRWPAVDAMGRGSGPTGPDPAPLPVPSPVRDPTPDPSPYPDPDPGSLAASPPSAARVILGRRSARAFDPRLAISAAAVYRLLEGCRPRPGAPPWDALGQPPRLHLLLFVHRVQGLDPGLYLLARDPRDVPGLRILLRPEFAWTRPRGCPDGLPLYGLLGANLRGTAQRLACHQRIAADSSLALGMLAELPADSPQARYDGLLREAGALGQVLYLESEALGLGASGIGCFFDEPIHEILGVPGGDLQTYYMFTLGPAIPDPLACDAPAYPRS